MGFWVYTLIMDLLIPTVMLVFGSLFIRKAPYKINHLYGYRTKRSMKNKETWEFAHKYLGKIWLVLGAILLPISIAVMLAVLGSDQGTVEAIGTLVCLVQLIPLIAAVIPTEIALKKKFDENGNRK